MNSYPLAAQNAYQDLLARAQDAALAGLVQTIEIRSMRGKKYYYSKKRIANKVFSTYLGPETDELKERIGRIKAEAPAKADYEARLALARSLRSHEYPAPDRTTGAILSALAKAGVFRLHGVLVGSHAYACYPALLGAPFDDALFQTEDIDIAQFRTISVAVDDVAEPDFEQSLKPIDEFLARPSLRHKTKSSRYRGKATGAVVELLTPLIGADEEKLIELPALKAYAQPLRFLDYLIYDPTEAVVLYRDGVLVNVPRPEKFAIHKLIVASRRYDAARAKAKKDIAQAAKLIDILAIDDPGALLDAWRQARKRGSKWRAEIDASVKKLADPTRAALAEAVGSELT